MTTCTSSAKKPVIHVSSKYPANRGCLALVAPLCRHPTDRNGIIVYDLREDPSSWAEASVEEIRQRLFTRSDALPEGVARIPLKILHVNRCPIVAPLSILSSERAAGYGIDFDTAERNWQSLLTVKDLPQKLRRVFDSAGSLNEESDPDYMIYSGFFTEVDRKLMTVVRDSSPEQLASLNLSFNDKRLPTLLFRYRARNFPETLDAEERKAWQEFRRSRLSDANRQQFEDALRDFHAAEPGPEHRRILEAVRDYTTELMSDFTQTSAGNT